MHLADGIIQAPALVLGTSAFSALSLALAVRQVSVRTDVPRLAWAGTLGAFALVAQAINVPVVPGVSAHAIGSSLLCLTLGPALAIVCLFCVLLIQAVFLGDGGITMLGVNTLTLVLLPVSIMGALRPRQGAGHVSVVLGTVLGNSLAAGLLTLLLAHGAGAPLRATALWLVGVQASAGLVEGLLTAIAWNTPPLREQTRTSNPSETRRSLDASGPTKNAVSPTPGATAPLWRWAALALCVLLLLVPFASDSPDALELVVERLRP